MHVLAAQAGRVDDGEEPVDLAQSPGDIVFLSAAETELSAFALDARQASLSASLRLASLLQLKHPYSVDLYADNTLAHAKLIVVRLIGGQAYWPYGMERLIALGNQGVKLIITPHEAHWNADLAALSTVAMPLVRRFWQLCVEGGPTNRRKALALLDALAKGEEPEAPEVSPLPRFGLCDAANPAAERYTGKARRHPHRVLHQPFAGRDHGTDPALCARRWQIAG
jgi:cobaltochelatase CobN